MCVKLKKKNPAWSGLMRCMQPLSSPKGEDLRLLQRNARITFDTLGCYLRLLQNTKTLTSSV